MTRTKQEFTNDMCWGGVGMTSPITININTAGIYENISPTTETYLYNMTELNGTLSVEGYAGIYLLNMSFTTSGATNDTLSARFVYSHRSPTTTNNSAGVEYDSKGGNEWAVNQSVIMQVINTDTATFKVQFANLDSTDDIELEKFMFSAIKIY